MQVKVRRVRTPAGRDKYGQEIGEIITPDVVPNVPIVVRPNRVGYTAKPPKPSSSPASRWTPTMDKFLKDNAKDGWRFRRQRIDGEVIPTLINGTGAGRVTIYKNAGGGYKVTMPESEDHLYGGTEWHYRTFRQAVSAIQTPGKSKRKDTKFLRSLPKLPNGPESIEDAAIHTNPMFGDKDVRPRDGFKVNCQKCVLAYELRRRGYAVEAAPGSPYGDELTNWVEFPGLIDPDKPSIGKGYVADAFVRPDTEPNTYWEFKVSACEALARQNKWPVGSRGYLEVEWVNAMGLPTGGAGHVISWELTESGLIFIDPQQQKRVQGGGFWRSAMPTAMRRLDDKHIVGTTDMYIVTKEHSPDVLPPQPKPPRIPHPKTKTKDLRADAEQIANDYVAALGRPDLTVSTLLRFPTWWVACFASKDIAFVIVEDSGEAHVEIEPFGKWFGTPMLEDKRGHVRDVDFWGAPYGTPLPLPKRFKQPRRFPDFIGKVGTFTDPKHHRHMPEDALIFRDEEGKRTGYIIQRNGYAQLTVMTDDGEVEASEPVFDLRWAKTRTVEVHDEDFRVSHYDIEDMHRPSRRMQYLMKRPYIQAAQRKGGKRRLKVKPLSSSSRFSDRRMAAMLKQQHDLGLTITNSRKTGDNRVPVSMGPISEETVTATMSALEEECPGIIDYVPIVGTTSRPVGGVTWAVTPKTASVNGRLRVDTVPYPHANVVLGDDLVGRSRTTVQQAVRQQQVGVEENPRFFSVDPFAMKDRTPEQSLMAEVLTHEVGHMLGYVCLGQLPNDGTDSVGDRNIQREFRHKFQTILADFGAIERRESFDTDVAKNPRVNDKEQGTTSMLALDTQTIKELLSEYGSTNLNEMLAEVWAEYMLADNPRPFAEAVGSLMEETFQKYRKFHAPEVRDYKEGR